MTSFRRMNPTIQCLLQRLQTYILTAFVLFILMGSGNNFSNGASYKDHSKDWNVSYIKLNDQIMAMEAQMQEVDGRLEHAKEMCKIISIAGHSNFSKTNNHYYCKIPRCASVFVDTFMNYLETENKKNYNNTFTDLQISSLSRHKFMFVRDPYSRLFSLYEGYFYHPSDVWYTVGVDIISKVRNNTASRTLNLGHDVTFTELVKYIVMLDDKNLTSSLFYSMSSICNPCESNFDFIGKLETFSDDLAVLVNKYLNKNATLNRIITIKEIESEIKYRHSINWITEMYQMYTKYKSVIPHFELLQRFWSSSQIRGKISKYYNIPYFKDDQGVIDENTFTRSFQSAMYASKSYSEELKAQHQEALVQAYRSVPIQLIQKLKKIVQNDCRLFGYDNEPDILFNRQTMSDNIQNVHDYFKGI